MSPIAGLTDTPKAFIKLGMIRKGEKVKAKRQDGSEYEKPVDLDHFRVTFQYGSMADQLMAEFVKVYGTAPTSLNIRFADADPSQVWDANYECYKQGGLIAKAGSRDTGPYWIFYRDPEDSEVLVRNGSPVGERGRALFDKPIDLEAPIYYNSKKEGILLEPVGRLQVVIPELAHLAVGFFTFQPGSPRDIRNITAELSAFDALARSAGKTITGIPFRLIRRKEEVTKVINGKMSKGDSWVVHLEAGGEWGRLAIETIERLALPEIIDAVVEEVEPEFDEAPLVEYTRQLAAVNNPVVIPPAVEPEPKDVIEILSQESVAWAAKEWNKDAAITAQEIGKYIKAGKLSMRMSKAKFKAVVKGTA